MKIKSALLMLMLFVIGVTVSYSQDTTLTASPPDTGKVTFTKVYNDVKQSVAGLSAALKVGAEHVYSVVVKQQVVLSITNTVMSVILIIVTSIFLKLFFNGYKRLSIEKDEWYRDDVDDHPVLIVYLVAGIIATLATIIFTLGSLQETITGFVNPEYGAMKDIVDFIK